MDAGDLLEKRKQRLKAIFEKDSSLPAENFKIVMDYLADREADEISEQTLLNNYDSMIVFCRFCKTPISELTANDVRDFSLYLKNHKFKLGGSKKKKTPGVEKKYSPFSRKHHKTCVKRFFSKYLKRADLAEKMQEYLKSDVSNGENPKRARRNLLTEEDVYKVLVPKARTARDKALISTFYECGVRRGEIVQCKVCHLDFNYKYGCLLTIPAGKTGPRPEPLILVRSKAYLRAWLENHPFRDEKGDLDPEAPLFVTSYTKPIVNPETGEIEHVHTALTENALTKQMKELIKRAKIKKPGSPHQYRHTCATRLAENGMNPYQLNSQMGWSNKSDTAGDYIHDVSVRKEILRQNGIEEEDPEQPKEKTKICPNCKERIDIFANYCPNCGYGDDAAQRDIGEKFGKVYQKFRKIARMHPEIQKLYDELDEDEEEDYEDGDEQKGK